MNQLKFGNMFDVRMLECVGHLLKALTLAPHVGFRSPSLSK